MSKKYLYQAFLDRPQFKTQILALLAQGPMWTNELVVRIGLDSNTTARLLAELKDTRKIERIRRKKQGSLWRLADASRPAPPPAPSEKPWVQDEEHQAWMAYWQTPRAERRRMENPP